MKIRVQSAMKAKTGVLVVPVFSTQLKKLPQKFPKPVQEFIAKRVKSGDFKGKKGETISTYLDVPSLPDKLIVVGLGKAEKCDATHAREMGGKLGSYTKAHTHSELAIVAPPELLPYMQEFIEGIKLAQYNVEKYKTSDKTKKKKEEKYELREITILTDRTSKELIAQCEKAAYIGEAVHFVRDLVNGPANIVNDLLLIKEARRIAKENRYKITVFGDKELKKMKWGGLLAVNQGANHEARCIVMEYRGAPKKKAAPLILIGKGMLFDSGGYNLKPTNCIETMQQDMAGAATVLGLFSILKKLRISQNVIGILPIAQNMINEDAYRPSDIITMYSGKTVEITNTDAEGRLILADAITYALQHKPASIITVATLTGAVAVAVGNRYAGLVGNNDTLRTRLQKAGDEVDDLGWPLPLHKDYAKKMESQVADLRNSDTGTSRYAGSSKGAAFLQHFVNGCHWCHIDIGGTAFTEDPKSYEAKGATAHSLRMLARFLEKV